MTNEWQHKEEWHSRGENFLVVIKRHAVAVSDPLEGAQRWCVYAYIYPKHPHFGKFAPSGGMQQSAATVMPLHRYPSLFRVHLDFDTKAITSFQVGADYNHLHDSRFTRFVTREEAYEVFGDAEELHGWLQRRDTPPSPVQADKG